MTLDGTAPYGSRRVRQAMPVSIKNFDVPPHTSGTGSRGAASAVPSREVK